MSSSKSFVKKRSLALALSVIGLAFSFSKPSAARICSGNDDKGCWTFVGNSINQSQVAVGQATSGLGIACTVESINPTEFGADVNCYEPVGTSGYSERAIYSPRDANSPFQRGDSTKKIVSIAVSKGGLGAGIFALRSDGKIYSASIEWPRTSPNPEFTFTLYAVPPPKPLRSISYAEGVGLCGVSADNQLHCYSRALLRWVSESLTDVILAVGSPTAGKSFLLRGEGAFAQTLYRFPGLSAAPPAAFPGTVPYSVSLLKNLAGDTNTAFIGGVGRRVPVASGPGGAWAIEAIPDETGTYVGARCPEASNTPCIARSRFVNGAWTGWAPYVTGDLYDFSHEPFYPMPWTIQDASMFRSRDGEIIVAAGFLHVKAWIPL